MNMSHFLTEMAEQILIRYQVKDIFYPAAILCYLGNYAQTTWGPPTACFITLKNRAAIYWYKKETCHTDADPESNDASLLW